MRWRRPRTFPEKNPRSVAIVASDCSSAVAVVPVVTFAASLTVQVGDVVVQLVDMMQLCS